jgi:hypothetical protein
MTSTIATTILLIGICWVGACAQGNHAHKPQPKPVGLSLRQRVHQLQVVLRVREAPLRAGEGAEVRKALNAIRAAQCPFRDHGRRPAGETIAYMIRFEPGGWVVECADCFATGPLGKTQREALAAWNGRRK